MKVSKISMGLIVLLIVACMGYLWKRYRAYNSCITITSFDQVDFNQFTQDDLIIFDIDKTLIQASDAYVLHEYDGSIRVELFKLMLLLYYPCLWNKAPYYRSLLYQQVDRCLIEPCIVKIIQKLQKRGVPVIACTFMNTGSFGLIDSMEQWRFKQLESFGIDFSHTFSRDDLSLHGFTRHPHFYKGILYTDLTSKGPVLMSFLDIIKQKPHRIIFFDDLIKNLISVKEACEQRKIPCVGYHYQGAQIQSFNEQVAWKQAKSLMENNAYISDEAIIASEHGQPASLLLNRLPYCYLCC